MSISGKIMKLLPFMRLATLSLDTTEEGKNGPVLGGFDSFVVGAGFTSLFFREAELEREPRTNRGDEGEEGRKEVRFRWNERERLEREFATRRTVAGVSLTV